MATKAQILKLSERIEALADRQVFRGKRKVALIVVNGESDDAARERHYRTHPQDRGATEEILLVVVDPPAAKT